MDRDREADAKRALAALYEERMSVTGNILDHEMRARDGRKRLDAIEREITAWRKHLPASPG